MWLLKNRSKTNAKNSRIFGLRKYPEDLKIHILHYLTLPELIKMKNLDFELPIINSLITKYLPTLEIELMISLESRSIMKACGMQELDRDYHVIKYCLKEYNESTNICRFEPLKGAIEMHFSGFKKINLEDLKLNTKSKIEHQCIGLNTSRYLFRNIDGILNFKDVGWNFQLEISRLDKCTSLLELGSFYCSLYIFTK